MIARDLEGWTIAFDLDGTLVDSAPDLIGTLNRMLAPRGYPPVPLSAARHLVGHGVRPLLRHGFAEAGAVWDETAEPELFDLFLADYVAHIADDSRAFDGVVETLDQLSARGAVLCVATNKRTDLAEALIGALGLTRHFAVVAGPDRVSARKPDGAHVREAVQLAGAVVAVAAEFVGVSRFQQVNVGIIAQHRRGNTAEFGKVANFEHVRCIRFRKRFTANSIHFQAA